MKNTQRIGCVAKYAFAALMVIIMIIGTVMIGMLEVNAADTKTDFDKKKSDALTEINALESSNSIVSGAMIKYKAQIEAIKYSEDDAANNATEYLNKVSKAVNDIVQEAHDEYDFLNKRSELLKKLESDYASKVNTGKYIGVSRTELDNVYREVATAIGNVSISEGIDKLASVYDGAGAKFGAVPAFVTVLKVESGDITGSIFTDGGFPESAKLNISKLDLKDASGNAPKADAFEISAEDVKAAVTDKKTILTFGLGVNGYTADGAKNTYTVTINIPEEYQGATGFSVISFDKDGKEYIHSSITHGKVIEFKTTMLENNYSIVSDITKNMAWLIVVMGILVLLEIVAAVMFTMKKNNLASIAIIPFLAVTYAPGNFVILASVFGAMAVAGAVVAGISAGAYFKAKKEAEAEDEYEDLPEDEDNSTASTDNAVEETSEKEVQEAEDRDPSDGEYDADKAMNETENESADGDDEGEYEADKIQNTYVEEEEERSEYSYSGNDGEYEADGDNVDEESKNANDADAEYGLKDDHVFAKKSKTEKSVEEVSFIHLHTPTHSADEFDQDENSEKNEKDMIILATDDGEELTDEKRVFTADDGQKVYVTYNYSFASKLSLSSEETRYRYQIISDTLLSYGLRKRQSWKQERYYTKGRNYVKLIFRGKTPCICFDIEPESLKGTKYSVEDVSGIKKYEDVPSMMRVRSGRGCKYAVELIQMMMETAGIKQQREVQEEFEPIPAMTKEELVNNGSIKVMMTDGNGEVVAADFETMKNSKFNLVSGGIALHKHVSVEEVSNISDETVAAFIEVEAETEFEDDDAVTYGSKKGIINIDTISASYKDGDVVTLKNLIAKGLVPKNIHFIKVLARGELDKALTVKAHDYSMDAAKMIVVAGGTVIELKSQKVKA